MTIFKDEYVTFTYKNWRGEISVRLVQPRKLFFDKSEWHKERQWLIEGYDVTKEAMRTFAMKDISDWNPSP